MNHHIGQLDHSATCAGDTMGLGGVHGRSRSILFELGCCRTMDMSSLGDSGDEGGYISPVGPWTILVLHSTWI